MLFDRHHNVIPLSAIGGELGGGARDGWVEHPTKFSKTAGLTRSQFLEGVSLFQGELQFSYKKN